MLNKIHVLITVPLLGLSAACSGGGGGSSDSSADSNVPKSLSYGLPRQSLMTEHEVDLAPARGAKRGCPWPSPCATLWDGWAVAGLLSLRRSELEKHDVCTTHAGWP